MLTCSRHELAVVNRHRRETKYYSRDIDSRVLKITSVRSCSKDILLKLLAACIEVILISHGSSGCLFATILMCIITPHEHLPKAGRCDYSSDEITFWGEKK